MISLTVNGEEREIADTFSIAEFLEECKLLSTIVVVELNGDIVPRERHSEIRLESGDVLEIVQMMAGG
jgi:sulfur carrier protein